MWQDYFQKVFVPNLAERTDRFERIVKMLYEYGIEATIWDATKHTDGKLGLIASMKNIFKWSLEQGLERVFIMEDDCDIVVSPSEFHATMDRCCEDLSNIGWDCFYAGLQHSAPFEAWQTPNLLRVSKGFSTHAVGYSKKAMEFICSAHIDIPVDNYLVAELQKHNTSFCSYPILCTQLAGHSNIYNDYIDWSAFIEPTFHKFVRDILQNRFKQ